VDLPPPGDIALVVAGALAAGFVNGLSGTGYALVSLGFWLHAMSPVTAAPLVAFCAVSGHIRSLPRIWSGVTWSRLWPFMVGGLIGVPIGTALLGFVQVRPLKVGVGVLLLLYCSWMGFVRRPPVVAGGGRLADGAAGIGGGVLGGMASLSGPIPVIWVQLRGWNMQAQRGVSQPYNMSVLALSLVSAGIAGRLDHLRHLGRHRAAHDPDRLSCRPAALWPYQRRTVPPHRDRAAQPVRSDPDRFVAGMMPNRPLDPPLTCSCA